jgi:hypothetical protein
MLLLDRETRLPVSMGHDQHRQEVQYGTLFRLLSLFVAEGLHTEA